MADSNITHNKDEIRGCLERAASALLSGRNPAGYWEGRLASSPLATAVALAALADGELSPRKTAKSFQYLSSTQNSDGGWGDTEISKSNLAATLLALSADAKSSGLEAAQRRRAEAYSEKLGGFAEGLRRVYGSDLTFQVPIRMTAACSGLLPWNRVDTLPFELALAPRGLMGALRLPVVSYALPALVSVGLARHRKAPSWMLPFRWLREAISMRALDAILKMQPQSGGYLEAIPLTAFCLLGLKAAGLNAHPVANGARRFLLDSQRDDGSWPVEVNLSVWNTTRAIDALAAAGLLETALTERERAATRDWLLAQQTTGVSVYSDAHPGGWGWNHLSGSVPDADDTSGAILALRHLGVPADHPAIATGSDWLVNLQNRNGGWPTFCRGWEKLPFDRSAPDLTAHALRALRVCGEGESKNETASEKGWAYLRRVQRPDGALAPLWFGCEQAADELNCTYGTTHVLFACAEAGAVKSPLAAAGLDWLRRIQNSDGGFGGSAGAKSSAEETGLALRALRLCGVQPGEDACVKGAKWLLERQRKDGSWNPTPIGFYFAVLWYYEELYPLYYAIGGLGGLNGCAGAARDAAEVAVHRA